MRMMPAVALTALLLAASAASASAAGNGSGMRMNDANIETDVTNANFNTGKFTMPNHVHMARPGSVADSDSAHGDDKKGTITLTGHVVVHDSGSGSTALTGGTTPEASGPSTLTCDTLDVDTKSKLYVAHGNVHFSQGARSGTSDMASLDRAKGVLHLEGHVILNDGPGASVTAEDVVDNLLSKDIDVKGSPAVLKQATPDNTGDQSVTSDAIHWNQNSGDFNMPGKASFARTGTDAVGDSANGNTKNATLSLRGHVTVHDNGQAPEAASEKGYSEKGPATITADALDVDGKSRIYTAKGNVDFSQGDEKGHADNGILDRGAGTLHLDGNVKLSQGDSTMSARVVDYNLNTKDVKASGAPVIIRQPAPSPAPKSATPKPKHKKLPF